LTKFWDFQSSNTSKIKYHIVLQFLKFHNFPKCYQMCEAWAFHIILFKAFQHHVNCFWFGHDLSI
jgi:hypothetical protein